jgi:hypothetical protein
MRIKSYFAPSVQAAIALARKEFGDSVTLVTSHVASLENRHLGEYEVVFAIEESIDVPQEKPEPPTLASAPAFNELLQQAIVAPSPMHQDLPEKLDHIHASLVALGLQASLVCAFMTMLRAAIPASTPLPVGQSEENPQVSESSVEVSEPGTIDVPTLEELPPPAPELLMPLASLAPPEVPTQAPRPFLSLFEAPRPQPRFSDAERAFMSSVSSPKEQGA